MKIFELNVLSCGLILGLTLFGCAYEDKRTLDPEKVANDFATNPGSSTMRYRNIWVSSNDVNGITLLDRITIAGELISRDTAHYPEYYQLITKSVESKDDTVAAAAANSLRDAAGGEPIKLLLRSLDSKRPVLARAAAHSISYKMVTLKNTSERSDEYTQLSKDISNRCSASSTPEYIRSVICGSP